MKNYIRTTPIQTCQIMMKFNARLSDWQAQISVNVQVYSNRPIRKRRTNTFTHHALQFHKCAFYSKSSNNELFSSVCCGSKSLENITPKSFILQKRGLVNHGNNEKNHLNFESLICMLLGSPNCRALRRLIL